MKLLAKSQLRFFRFAPWSTLTVMLGVTLAVASIVAVHQISQRVVVSLAAVTPPHLAEVTHLLTRPGMVMSDYFALRALWRAGEYPAVQGLMPLVDGFVTEGDSPGAGRALRVIGVDAFSGVESARGLALLQPGQVIAGGQSKKGRNIRLGGRDHEVALTSSALPEDMLITDIGTAQAALGRQDMALDAIAVQVASPGQLFLDWGDRLMPGLSSGVTLKTFALPGWEVRTVAEHLPSLNFARSVLFNLGALGTLALVVAWLLVYQVSVIWLRRRASTLSRLKQMGVTEWELKRTFLLSLTGLGLLASLLGLVAGEQLADALARAATGYSDGLPSIPLDRWVLGKAVGSALLVCLVGGWVAYQRESNTRSRSGLLWLVCLAAALTGGYGLLGSESLLGGFAAIAAVALIVLAGISPLLVFLRGLSGQLRGRLLTRIGLRELLWYPGDLAIAIGALVLALATSVAMALMVDSFREDFENMLDQRMVYDLFVNGPGTDLSPLADHLQSVPGVSAVQRYGRAEVRIRNLPVSISHSRFDEQESRRYGLAESLGVGKCLINERMARTLNLEVGEELVVGDGVLSITGTFSGFGEPAPRLLLNTADALTLGIPSRFDRLSISSNDHAKVQEAVRRWDPTLEVENQRVIRERALSIFDQTFAITRALTFLALMVASVGLYNALLALELLQQPSRKLLEAMGLTLRERRIIAGWRVVGVGVAAVVLALPLGILMGWLLCTVINPRAFGWSLHLQLNAAAFVWPALSALGVMVVVGLAPTPSEAGEEALR